MTEAERRKLARDRRRRVRDRVDLGGAAEPEGIRVDPRPLLVEGRDIGVYEPLLVPDRNFKDEPGRYPYRTLVVRLTEALSLRVLIAFHTLQIALETRVAAENALGELGLPSLKNLLRDGRRLLSKLTIFTSEDELRRWSIRRVAAHRLANGTTTHAPLSGFVDGELSIVRLVNIGRLRAQILLATFEAIQRRNHIKMDRRANSGSGYSEIDLISHAEIQAAFDRHPASLCAEELWALAMNADINPAPLWPRHIRLYAQLLEIARFLGRVDRGVEARLASSHLALVAEILRAPDGPFGDDRDRLAQSTRIKLQKNFALDLLLDHIDCAIGHDADLTVERGTGELAIDRSPRPA